jgi:Protein of unknown function (DUF4246)
MTELHVATTPDFAFVNELLTFGESYKPRVGDVLQTADLETRDGEAFPGESALVIAAPASDDDPYVARDPDTGIDYELATDSWFTINESPYISGVWERHLRRAKPEGVAFADGLVSVALTGRLRASTQRLMDLEPVDYHPGSGTRVRDLVHPSLYPFIDGKTVCSNARAAASDPKYDRFGRLYERSKYQWLPSVVQINDSGTARIDGYINNLDRDRHAAAYTDMEDLFSVALPLIESVLGYVTATELWREDHPNIEHEADLPDNPEMRTQSAAPLSLRGRELLVIPKIVEYQLSAGETHEGVWHVEGMSHEHIVATCVFVLDRDELLEGGNLRFKRPYTVGEAGRLFWKIDQSRPGPAEALVAEGTVPVGELATPAGRLLVFPNSHIHKLSPLSLAAGDSCGRRRVIVFWIVDPAVSIPSTRDVAPQQSIISHQEAIVIRLQLMEERKRHKQSLNVRAVSLCEH